MRRKLVKQGPSTLTVSIPSQWVHTNNLKAGQDVQITIQENRLIVTPESKDEEGLVTTIDARELSKSFIGYLLSALHKKGYDEIRLSVRPDQVPSIQKAINKNLLGFEIIQQTDDMVTIRFVTKIDAHELPVLTRRTFLVTLALAEGAATTTGDGKELLTLEETNNRLSNYCERVLIKNIHYEKNPVFMYIIIWLLEKIADHYREVIEGGKLRKEDGNLCLKLLKEYYELFYKYSLKRHESFIVLLEDSVEKLRKHDSPYLPILLKLDQTKATTIALNVQ